MKSIARLGSFSYVLITLALAAMASRASGAGSADLMQARNGTPSSPTDPVEWVKGNAGPANSHYVEGFSIPYRVVISGASLGSHRLVLEWDTTQKGKHAIDFLTSFDRLLPHGPFGEHNTAETINPLAGVSGPFTDPVTIALPAPSIIGSPVAGQPAASFGALPADERVITIWNGTVTSIEYVREDSPAAESGVSQIAIEFDATASTVVIAFGGHIALKSDWGTGNSAASIGGSPYHMRMISFDGGGGNQDRSLQAVAVLSPPTCFVSGPDGVCGATTNTFTITSDASGGATYRWSLDNNTSGATIVGATDGSSVRIASGSAGSFDVEVVVSVSGASSACSRTIQVAAVTAATSLADQTVCLGITVTFRTTASGTGPFSFVWRKGGNVIAGATDAVLTLDTVSAADAGIYSVEVTGTCGTVTHYGALDVKPAPVLTCPPNVAVQCLADVPPPAPGSVAVTGGSGAVNVSHVSDIAVTNGCEILISRTYRAIDACGIEAVCQQAILVRDTVAPIVSGQPNRTVECGAAWDFNPPTAADNCDGANAIITVAGTVTNAQCGNTLIATRTWQATDACGNAATVSQTISVVDTTAPVIPCAPSRNVECGAAWDFDAPVATDVCGDVTIAIMGTVTNQLAADLFSATRTWQATDACGNTASCSQTITVVDMTPPVILCPANITILCNDEAGAGVSFSASATDVCDANPQLTCQPASGSIFAIGVTTVDCVAVDASGNRSECSFTVTVQDTETPQIVCPASFAVVETTDGSGMAFVTYPNPTATDNCDASPALVCSPPSGSTLAVGTHVVTCTATDDSGNQTSCTFTVQVVPRVIVANSTADSGPGTLRQALLDANAAPGNNVIQFAFPGNPPYTIQLLSPLPPLGDGVTIDGWSQLQFTGLPVIEVNGTNVVVPPPNPGTNSAGGNVGLVITAGGTVVRGLSLNGFEIGIRVDGPGGNVIQGNRIGTDVAGTTALPNTGDGIVITSPGNVVGGGSPSARNIVSGNRGSGIRIMGSNANSNVIRGNYIGIAADGASPLGNLLHGVRISSGASGNTIGGSQPGEGNIIAFNGGSGILLDPDAGSGNLILGNSIYANGGLGIDLGGDGSTGNDTGDTDEGPNGLQNAPVLSHARSLGGKTTIAGMVAGAPNSTLMLEFFLSAAPDESGIAPPLFSLGTATVTTDVTGDQSFSATFPVASIALQFVTATATDAGNNTSEFSPAVPVGTPPVILVQPVGAQVGVGSSVTFCVTAIGSQPLLYQWRLNGANVPNATNRCLTIPDVQLMNGGSYTVVIANDLGIALSAPAPLSLVFGDGIVKDDFADRVRLVNASGIKSGDNSAATLEPGEPVHRGQPGGKSVWYTWTPPGTGIATFNTAGSGFDTLLAVYSGSNLLALVTEASDEDSGGFYTSERSFNVFEGLTYQIAIDGLGGASGNFIINWTFEPTRNLLPVITNQPVSKTVAGSSTVTFTVGAFGTCRGFDHDCRSVSKDGHPQHPDPQRVLSYQWFFNGVAIAGAIRSTLTIENVQENVLGLYYAELTDDHRTVRSDTISLQINETEQFVQNIQARDKYLNAVYSPPLSLGAPASAQNATGGGAFQAASTVVRGYTGTQVFNTAGSSTEAGEEPICGVVGGASQWISFIAQETGTAFFNTDGSSYNTVIAAFTRMANSPMLQYVDCDDDGGLDGRDSALVVPVQAGRTNFIVIDGVNGATGVLRLNYSLVTATFLAPMGTTPEGDSRVRVSGRPNLRFTLQRSTNLQNWSSLITTNSASGVFDYVDPGSANMPGRFYRALLLP